MRRMTIIIQIKIGVSTSITDGDTVLGITTVGTTHGMDRDGIQAGTAPGMVDGTEADGIVPGMVAVGTVVDGITITTTIPEEDGTVTIGDVLIIRTDITAVPVADHLIIRADIIHPEDTVQDQAPAREFRRAEEAVAYQPEKALREDIRAVAQPTEEVAM